jgi:hypothetical protein
MHLGGVSAGSVGTVARSIGNRFPDRPINCAVRLVGALLACAIMRVVSSLA